MNYLESSTVFIKILSILISSVFCAAMGTTVVHATTIQTIGELNIDQNISETAKSIEEKFNPTPNLQTGAFQYSYSFFAPPGQEGSTPNIYISYSSQGNEHVNMIGAGWNSNVSYIKRIATYGNNTLYQPGYHEFVSSIDGMLLQVSGNTSTGVGEYKPKHEQGTFVTYTLTEDNYWIIKDQAGNTQIYGQEATARQQNGTNTYAWYQQQAKDTNGNTIDYTYNVDAGMVYLDTISYGAQDEQSHPFEIRFIWEEKLLKHQEHTYYPQFFVQGKYRLANVQAYVEGTKVREFLLTYDDTDAVFYLKSITEVGFNAQGEQEEKPPVQFQYEVEEQFNTPIHQESNVFGSQVTFGDFNGDAVVDALKTNQDTAVKVNINKGHELNLPESELETVLEEDIDFKDVVILDINGDGTDDIIRIIHNVQSISASIIEDGHAVQSWSWATGVSYENNYTIDFQDMNGDGLSDVLAITNDPLSSLQRAVIAVYLNNGHGFNTEPAFTFYNVSKFASYADVNSDGLVDFVYTDTSHREEKTVNAQLATQPGVFNGELQTYTLEHRFRTGDIYNIQASDLTMDGKNDLVITYKSHDGEFIITELFANNGNGFDGRYTSFASESGSNHYVLRKMSLSAGDYYLNFIKGRISESGENVEYQKQAFVQTNKKLLQRITHQEGGKTEIDYKPASHYYTNAQQRANTIPYATYLVDVVTSTDGVAQTYTTTYNYLGGQQWFQDGYNKQFASFSEIEITNSKGEKTIHYYHQGNGDNPEEYEQADTKEKIGRLYKQEIFDSNNQLFQRTRNVWGSTILMSNLGTTQDQDRAFVYLEKTSIETFDGNETHKDTSIEYLTNTQNGNRIQETDLGDVIVHTDGTITDVPGDTRTTNYTYAEKNGRETPFVSQVTILNEQSQKAAEQKTYYDNLPHGQVDKGNATKEEQWVEGSTYINTQTQYNNVGLPTRTTDANGNHTTITYDAYTLYPATITNALGHTVSYTYNLISGDVERTQNVNGIIVKNEFDGFGRTILTKQSDIESPSTFVTIKKTTYTDFTSPRYIRESVFFDEGRSIDTLTFFDRFGRVLQTKTQGEEDDLYITQDYTYEELSTPHTQTLPYYAFGSSYTPPTTNENLVISQTYDALGRVIDSTHIIGTTNQAYDERITTITDANGNEKSYKYDTRGNLVTVQEQEGEQTFTTRYTYDMLGNLTRITDAEGNIRNFTYDGLSRKITEELLHTASGQIEQTIYQYDSNGNITRQTNPDGQVIITTYDELNRTLEEYKQGNPEETIVIYGYDSCQYGIGLLCSVSAREHTDVYGYDTFQRPTLSIRTVDGVDYISQVTYDYLGTPKTITHTDGTIISYQFNAAGQVSAIYKDEEPLVTGVTYAPNGQIEHITYANGVETTNTYDQHALYRLINKTTLGNEHSSPASTSIPKSVPSAEDLAEQNEITLTPTDDGYIRVYARAGTGDEAWDLARNWDGVSSDSRRTAALIRDEEIIEGKNLVGSRERTLSRGYITFDTGLLPDTARIIEAELIIHVEPGNELSPSYAEQYYLTTIDMEGANIVGRQHYNNFLEGTRIGSINLDSLPLSDEYEVAETDVSIAITSQSARESLSVTGSTTISLVHVYDFTNRSFSSNTTAHFSSVESPGIEDDPRLRIVYVLGEAPTAPTDTKVNNLTNPINVFDKTPEFTAIHHDPDTGDLATKYQIQVADENGNFSNPIWDSGIVDLAQPVREGETSIVIPYGGERLQLNGQTYTYRIKFFERFYYESPWSDVGTFTMATIDNEPVHINCANALYGEENPQNLNCTVPVFNILNNTGGTMQEVIIEVANNASFSSSQITRQSVTVLNGERTGNIVYTGNRLNQNQTYYVRTAFVDTNNTQTSYSATHTFSLANREILQDIDYMYDLVGNIVELRDNQEGTTSEYEYDDIYRLSRWTLRTIAGEQVDVRSQTYSPIGNILSKSNVPGNYQYASQHPHAPSSISGVAYTYDDNGNLTKDKDYTYTWDHYNRLTSATNRQTAEATQYTYDHTGQRLTEQTTSDISITPNQYIEITNDEISKRIYAGSAHLATIKTDNDTEQISYIHPDHLNGASVITDELGDIRQRIRYYPFGETRIEEGEATEDKLFTGHKQDETGLYYANARYLNPVTGQFTSIDPASRTTPEQFLYDPQQLNSYSYVRNNPVVLVDESGESSLYFVRTLTNYVIGRTPNIPHSIRQASFAFQYPLIAIRIGAAYDGTKLTLSSHASNFAVNITFNSETYGNQAGEGTIRNALRHTIWQGILTNKFGPYIAEQAGNSHEYNPFADLSIRSYSDQSLADQTADLLNNKIGRSIVLENSELSPQGIAIKSLDYLHEIGLYTTKQNSDGKYLVTQEKITDSQYKESLSVLSKLNNYGLKK